MHKAKGIDISVWQDKNSTPQMFNFEKARDMGISFSGIKTSQSLWADPDYAMNWFNAKKYVYRLPYHFLVWETDPKRQAETFWSLLEKDTFGLLPLTSDFEWWKVTPPEAMDKLYNFMERLKELSSPLPLGIYTAKTFWEPNGSDNCYWNQYYLWLCDVYGAVEVPKPWTDWAFHQYTFKLDGLAYGSESLDLDGDYFNGTREEMIVKFNLPELDVAPPIILLPIVNNLYRVETMVTIRTLPSLNAPGVGYLTVGTLLEIVEIKEADNYLWGKHSKGWSAICKLGFRYLTKV